MLVFLVFTAGIPTGILFFEGGQRLWGIIGVAGRGEAEDFSFGGGEGTDELAEDRILTLVGVVAEALPIVVGAAEAETPGIALAVGAQLVAGRVHGVIGEDAQGAGFADERLGLAHIAAMFFGDQPERCLVFGDFFEVVPEDELTEGARRI